MSKKQNGKFVHETKYAWQDTVQDVFRASPAFRAAKIKAAEKAIIARLSDDELGLNERTAIKDALSIFRILAAEAHPSAITRGS